MIALTLIAAMLAAPPTPSPAQAKAAAARFKAAVKAGRAASKAGNQGEAIKQLRAAAKLDPSNATVLAELGWVLFKAGDLDLAERTSRRALVLTDAPKVQGMLYYNLGRITEARGQALTREHYRRSLALRDNATVRKRLAALGEVPATKGALDTACASAKASFGCGDDDLACTCVVERTIDAPQARSGGEVVEDAAGTQTVNTDVLLRAAVLKVDGDGNGVLSAQLLAVETGGGGWQLVGILSHEWTPGVSYIHYTGTLRSIEFSGAHADFGYGQVLVARTVNNEADGDYGDNTFEISTREELTVCFASPTLACARLLTGGESGLEVMIEGEPVDAEVKKALGTESWKLAAEVKAGAVHLRGDAKGARAALVGRHPFAALGTLPHVQLTPLR
jgi:tetratricopeptide (TPR) repeat protein